MSAWPHTSGLPDAAFVLPRLPTASVLQVLRLLPTYTRPISQVLQRAGVSVPTRPEDEHAHALAFLLPFAIAYGDDWWLRAQAELEQMDPGGPRH